MQRIAWNLKPWIASTVSLCLIASLSGLVGCDKKKPAGKPSVPTATAPVATQPATSAPASQPVATRPVQSQPAASRPASTFSTEPPYPVKLYVRSPNEKQPGWLKVVELDADADMAVVSGLFPEQNQMEVETRDVKQLRLHIGYLPLAPRKRIVLRIDGQGIELARKDRAYVILERSPTGAWSVIKSLP